MTNLSEVMKRAWAIARDRAGIVTFSEALRMSWAVERGFSHGFETSYLDGDKIVRVMRFASSYSAAHSDCIEAKRWIVAAGFKPTGSSEFNLVQYMPQRVPESVNLPLQQAA